MRNLSKVGLVLLIAAFIFGAYALHQTHHRFTLTTYFQTAPHLVSGAPVWIDGVQLGHVKSVRVRPELGERPVEVLLTISSPYSISIPSDSTVSIASDGVLGPTVLDIDTRQASGLPIANHGSLRSLEAQTNGAENLAQALGNAVKSAVETKSSQNDSKASPK